MDIGQISKTIILSSELLTWQVFQQSTYSKYSSNTMTIEHEYVQRIISQHNAFKKEPVQF